MMKWSFYNELIEDTAEHEAFYLFNCLREEYFAIDMELKDLILSSKADTSIIGNAHPNLYKYLVDEKFFISTDEDELSVCIEKLNKKFSSGEHLRITINPTLDCNLKCWYCYENHLKGSCMQATIVAAIVKFIRKQVVSDTLKKVQLSFFGGEPLLKYETVVKPIVESVSRICKEYNKLFMLSFTTNGICLTPKVVKELKVFSEEISVQVAFDGNKEFYNQVKYLKSGKGCYDIVKKNLSNVIENGILTTIRCNYTLSTLISFVELIEDFKEYWNCPNVRFTFHRVWQESESIELFAKREEFKQKIAKFGIQSNIESYYGDSLTSYYADFDNNVVINYNGDVYKCTARNFNPENRLGYLNDLGEIVYNKTAKKCFVSSLTQQCYTCKLLPICTVCFQRRSEVRNGKCPIPYMYENADINVRKYFCDIITQNNFVR